MRSEKLPVDFWTIAGLTVKRVIRFFVYPKVRERPFLVHSLISSGTSPKMLNFETEARPVAYGGMLVGGIISTMALIAATVLMPGDYFAINAPAAAYANISAAYPTVEIEQLSKMVGMDVAHRPGGAHFQRFGEYLNDVQEHMGKKNMWMGCRVEK